MDTTIEKIIKSPLQSTEKTRLIAEILKRYAREHYRTPEEIVTKLDTLHEMSEDSLKHLKNLYN